MRYWAKRDRDADAREREQAAKDAERARHRDILYESLKWFEGGTQKRSIGIAVVNTSWPMFEEFRPLWVEVFANQAIYLLTVSDQKDKPHEHDNLRRIMEVVIREHSLLQPESYRIVLHTIEEKLKGQPSGGLTLTEELKARLSNWKNEISRRT
jgi:hypothetical protein